jgi:hypothetical protein
MSDETCQRSHPQDSLYTTPSRSEGYDNLRDHQGLTADETQVRAKNVGTPNITSMEQEPETRQIYEESLVLKIINSLLATDIATDIEAERGRGVLLMGARYPRPNLKTGGSQEEDPESKRRAEGWSRPQLRIHIHQCRRCRRKK